MARQGPHEPWDAFQAANPDLFAFRPGILDTYYSKETLGSDLARRVFVLPDRLAESEITYPPATAPRTMNGSVPMATASGSGVSGGS
jgi:hypothetical protein